MSKRVKRYSNGINRREFLKRSGEISALAGLLSVMNGGFLTDSFAAIFAHPSEKTPEFVCARPVWAKGRETEMNVTLRFDAELDIRNPKGVILRVTGATIMKVFVNGQVAGYGPARGPHGWFRIDEWDLAPYLTTGKNRLEIVISGYNANSFYHLDQPSFFQAEVADADGKILAASLPASDSPQDGASGPIPFAAYDLTPSRIQRVQRFSFQRPFIEVYRYPAPEDACELAEQPPVLYLPRRVPYPEFAILYPSAWGKRGRLTLRENVENPWQDRSLVNIGPELKGYPREELEIILSEEIQKYETELDDNADPLGLGSIYEQGDAQIVDFGANYAGFFRLKLQNIAPGTTVALTFDEIAADNGDVDFLRLGTCAAIQWTFGEGGEERELEAFEPHVGRYAKIHCLAGSFALADITMREYAYPAMREARFTASDKRLEKLFEAAKLTCRENAVDAFTDCPHRERAGWLCDSFFTARAAFDLTGKTDVETAFLENYRLPEHFAHLPDGALPMCYPADHYNGQFIPNWILWFVMQLAEYARRADQPEMIRGLQSRVEKVMEFFTGYENADGLLEKLPSWVFIEWSKANEFVQDVNYPSNMLYAAALEAAGQLYENPLWLAKAKKIRKVINNQSFDGEFFVDNALRKEDGSLEITRNRSEVCQYFAFFFKTATPESHPQLWQKLLDEFGPYRVKEGKYPEIHKANTFVGNTLRLELLSQAGRGEQLLEESVAYNEYMADRTGTLWENDGAYASCNHGFASHLCRVLYRDVLGIASVDLAAKKILIRFQRFENLDWAEGKQPLPGGLLAVSWKKREGRLVYKISIPRGWKLEDIQNDSGLEWAPR